MQVQAEVQPAAAANWVFSPRPMEEHDQDLVFGGWIDSLRGQMPYSQMRNQVFKAGQTRLIQNLLHEPEVEVVVAAAPGGEPKYGFICYEWDASAGRKSLLLHYLYVRSMYRRGRVATTLLEHTGVRLGEEDIVATHWTKDIRHYRDKWNLSYNPWVAWEVLR